MAQPKVLWIPTTNSGVAYWRGYNFWVAAHRTGLLDFRVIWWQWKIKNEIHPWQVDVGNPIYMARIVSELEAYARTADVIVCQRVYTPDALALLEAIRIKFPGTPLLAETDDDVMNTPPYNPAHGCFQPGSPLLDLARAQFRMSDGIIVTTPALRELYSQFNDRIWEIPNAIDLQLWSGLKNRPRPKIRIGWIGGASHDEDLRLLLPAIPEVLKAHPQAVFVIVHAIPEFLRGLSGVECVHKWAHIKNYPRMVASQDFDIGLAPLRDNAFNRGKTNLRWLEYSALGIPTVASAVGHYASTIRDGEDGLLVRPERQDDWAEKISSLVSDRKYRKAMGARARRRITDDFNVDKIVKKYKEAVEEVLSSGPSQKIEQTEEGARMVRAYSEALA